MTPLLRAFVTLLTFTLGASALGRESFTRFGEDEGLRSAAVYGVVQDGAGFLWVSGSSEGLFRFDGSEFRLFPLLRADELVEGRIPDTGSLLRDNQDRLWVTTWGYGAFVLSADRRQIRRYVHDSADPQSLAGDQVQSLHQSADGSVWLGTTQGLNRVRPDGRIERVIAEGEAGSLREQRIWSLASDLGTLWIATSDGLYGLRLEDYGLRVHRLLPPEQAGERGNEIRVLERLRDGSLWAGTRIGPMRFEPSGGVFQTADSASGDGERPRIPPVNAMVETPGGDLLVGTQSGLFRLDPNRRKLLRFIADGESLEAMSAYDVRSLALDRSELLWVGTRQGALFSGLAEQRFAGLGALSSQIDVDAIGRSVRAVHVDDDDTLWIGSPEGVFGVALAGGRPRELRTADGTDPEGIPLGIVPAADGGLWIATDEGLYRNPPGTLLAEPVALTADNEEVAAGDIRALALGRDGSLLVGLWNQGALLLEDGAPPRWLVRDMSDTPGDSVYALLAEEDGSIWVGSRYSGLFRVDPEGRLLEHYVRGPQGDDAGLPHNGIYAIARSRDRTLWVGTDDGLAYRPAGRSRFEVIGRSNGLPNARVVGLLEDRQGLLWVLTRGGLARIDPTDGEVVAFRQSDGLPSNEFNRAAAAIDRHGRVFVGTTEGLVFFDPERTHRNATAPRVAITGVQIDSRPVDPDLGLDAEAPLRLPRDTRALSVRFAALDFTDFDANRYRHRLLGFEREWQDAGPQRQASYTNLAPGDYRLEIEGTNNHGLWSERPAVLHLRMEAAWWQSLWGQLLIGAGLLGMVGGIPGLRLRRARALARQLELEVRNRTSELSDKNEALEDALEQVRRLSLTDPLTGVGNRRHLESTVGAQVALALRRHASGAELPPAERPRLFFLLVDIDHFKRINDRLGHAAGDAVLQAVAHTLQQALRESDTVVRWGGEEFLIAAPMISLDQARALAARLLALVAACRAPLANGDGACTCSIGFCGLPLFDAAPQAVAWEDAVALADFALYRSKERGRNRWTGIIPGRPAPLGEQPRRLAQDPEAALARGEVTLIDGDGKPD